MRALTTRTRDDARTDDAQIGGWAWLGAYVHAAVVVSRVTFVLRHALVELRKFSK